MSELLSISTDDCTIERDGAVVIITMNRPEKKNALSATMLVGLADAYTYVDDTHDIRCAILTGSGGAFSSGMDLVSMGEPRSDYVERRMSEEPNLHWKGLLRDYRCSKPMIAAVEGHAVAGGTEMLQGTDIRIAGEGAIFGVWEARRALFRRPSGPTLFVLGHRQDEANFVVLRLCAQRHQRAESTFSLGDKHQRGRV